MRLTLRTWIATLGAYCLLLNAPALASLEGVDIGTPAMAGSLLVDGDEVTVAGGGSSLWSWTDSFCFAQGPVTGDVVVTARLVSYQNIQTYTKAGIMIRESLAANSRNAFCGQRGGGSATFQRRTTDSAGTSETRIGGSRPLWLRLQRAGDDFTAWSSTDGVAWTQIGETATIAMSETVHVGLAVSAGNDAERVEVLFDSIDGIDTSLPPNQPPVAEAGADLSVADLDDSGSAAVTLDASGSYDPDGSIVEYLWSENGQSLASGVSPQVTLPVGEHLLTLTVADDRGDSAADTVSVTVTPYVNHPPVAAAGADRLVADGDQDGWADAALDASASYDDDGSIVSWQWYESDALIASGVAPELELALGDHLLTLVVVDDDGDTASDELRITVVEPVLALTCATVGGPSVAAHVELDVEDVTLVGGGEGFGDTADLGIMAYQQIDGDAMVTARVDEILAPGAALAGVMIRSSLDTRAPNAFLALDVDGFGVFQSRPSVGAATEAVADSSPTPRWLRLARYGDVFSAYVGDDGVHWTALGEAVTIPMAAEAYAGLAVCADNDIDEVTAVFTLPAIDDSGNAAPLAEAGDDRSVTDADENGDETVVLDASLSSDYDGAIVSYAWSEAGEPLASGEIVAVSLAVGRHTLTLTVVDDRGATASDEVVITVNPYDPLTPQAISEYKSGISLEVLGDYGQDYLVEQGYHDPRIDPHCTIYIRSDVPMNLFHNADNITLTGDSVGECDTIGVNGLDGIPDSGDEGIIRFRVDQEMTTRAMWADSTVLYPAWDGPTSFDEMEYDPGVAVVGATGPLPGGDITDPSTFYWRGMIDGVGDEWHILAVGDDDTTLQSYYANRSSDGKIYTFVVNPTTPACNIVARTTEAQFYTTPPKTYFVPVIRDQVSYVSGDCNIELAALGGAEVQYSLALEGQPETWQVYETAINTLRNALQADARYALKYRIGDDGPIKTRIIHFDPAYPSDGEVHPKNILWQGEAGLERIRHRMGREPYATEYNRFLNTPFVHQRTAPYLSTLMTGQRLCNGPTTPSAFPLLIEGIDSHPECSSFLRKAMLDTWMNLDPVGLEGIWSLNSPSREINSQGYANAGTPMGVALAYDWLIKEFRAGLHPDGFTAIEDYKLRDNLAAFCNWTAYTYSKPGNPRTAAGFSVGMWHGAWTHYAAMISVILDTYDNDLYGTSGAPGGVATAPRPWTPYPNHPRTWWQVFNDREAVLYGYPDQDMGSTFWGLLSEDYLWADRTPYWGILAGFYYRTMNFRHNFDGYHYPHLDQAVKMIAEGGQVMPLKNNEGALHHASAQMLNRAFPEIAPIMQASLVPPSSLAEQSIDNSLWKNGVWALCFYDDLWDRVPGDADGDGHVNVNDFIILKQHYNIASGMTVSEGDFNDDGAVNVNDFIILKQNYNK